MHRLWVIAWSPLKSSPGRLPQLCNFVSIHRLTPRDLQLPRANKLCPSCGETEAVFFQSQQRSAETGMVRPNPLMDP